MRMLVLAAAVLLAPTAQAMDRRGESICGEPVGRAIAFTHRYESGRWSGGGPIQRLLTAYGTEMEVLARVISGHQMLKARGLNPDDFTSREQDEFLLNVIREYASCQTSILASNGKRYRASVYVLPWDWVGGGWNDDARRFMK